MSPPVTSLILSLTARHGTPPIISEHAVPPHHHAPTLQRARAHRLGHFRPLPWPRPRAGSPLWPQLQRARLRSAARHRHVPSPRCPPRVPWRRAALPRRPRHRVPVSARTRLSRRAVPAHPGRTRLASARIRTESALAALALASYATAVPCAAHGRCRTPASTKFPERVPLHLALAVHATSLARARAAFATASLRRSTLHRVAMDGVHSTLPCAAPAL
jgi:hypothetical protein